ncbi:TSEN54 [Bugula neritina]|uniref:TSEN54 n=1 Tax=Bugula neritina TaxID=10212 RepID=A0A7J7J3B8_BUGNE|nr:TSEN54 [Bugula neritina]
MASPVHSRSHSDSALSSTTDLWSQHKQSADLSSTLGMKHGVSDGSFLQAKQLEFLQKQMVQQISGLKVDKLSSLSIGDYDVSQNVVVLRQLKGKIWSHCGNTIDNKMLLYPEEAYFLMDMSVLRVYLAGCPLSLQEASQYFFRDAWCTLNHCLVYGYLSRLGYIIRRMPQANHMASTEENLMLPAHKRKLSCELNEPKPKSVKSVEEPDIESESSMLDRVSGDTCVLSENSGMNEVFPCPTVPKDCQLSTSKDFDYSNIEFPASGGMRVKSNASTCSDDFLPATESSTTSDLEHHFDYFSLLDFRETKRVTRTTSWPDFKLAHKTRLENCIAHTQTTGHW